jgi:hypothetical protein
LQTVHLTPVPPDAASAGQINLFVGRWFERIQQAVHRCAGTTPHASEPEWLSISAEPAWNRKGLPLTFGFALTSFAAWMLMPQSKVPAPIGLSLFLMSILLLIGALWFCAGFLQANRALWRGDLDAVTSDEPPPGAELGGAGGAAAFRRRKARFGLLNLSTLGVIIAGLALPLGLLLWEAWLFPAFGERIFGKHSAAESASKLVLDAVSPQYGPGSHDPREFGGRVWRFNCLVPPNHLAQVLFVRWINSVPMLEPGFSAYYKTGHAPAGIDLIISCEPEQGTPGSSVTNVLLWNVCLGLGYTAGNVLPARPSFRMLDTSARMTALSGHQRVIRLLDYPERPSRPHPAEDGIELRVLLEPLKSPAMRTVPSEKELNNCIGGSGLELSVEETLKLMKRLPAEP